MGVIGKKKTKAIKRQISQDTSNVLDCLILPLEQSGDFSTTRFSEEDYSFERKISDLRDELAFLKEQEHDVLNTFKANLFSRINHEVRTPLNGILGISALLKRNIDSLTPEVQDLVQTLNRLGEHLKLVLDDIDHWTKIGLDHFRINESEVKIEELAKSVHNSLDIIWSERGLNCQLGIDSKIPDIIKADALNLESILFKVLFTAAEISESDKMQFKVQLDRKTSRKAWIKFTTTIMESSLNVDQFKYNLNMFDDLHKDIDQKQSGTGLGVFLVKKMVKNLYGEFEVHPFKESGLNITIRLPFNVKSSQPKKIQNKNGIVELEEELIAKELHILAVEDNDVNQFILEKFLGKIAKKVHLSSNGEQAINALKKEHYDLILMDINMPVMDGYAATQFIREQMKGAKSQIPILALTGSVFKSTNEFIKLGFSDYLLKPYEKESLFRKIQELVIES